uniref:vitamin-K-epoxide reductase (warfarin-sensitive) n=1 Tax=Cacopsylla melanoneura TaxID=428564 RepID=A0A8D9AJF6_9HEMI
MSTGVVNFFARGLCLAGLGICAYAFVVLQAKHQNPKHVPYCDIDAQFNCTGYLTSAHAKGFGLVGKYLGEKSPLNQPNVFYGMGTYAILLLLSFLNYLLVTRFALLVTFAAVGSVAYLNYISYFLFKQICPIEVAAGVATLLLLVVTLVKVSKLKGAGAGQKNKNKKKKQK